MYVFREGNLSAPEGGVITVQPEAAVKGEEMETRRYSQTDEHSEEVPPSSVDHEGMSETNILIYVFM